MAQKQLKLSHEVLGVKVTATVDIEGSGVPDSASLAGIYAHLDREVERIAQIVGVNVKDQQEAVGRAAVQSRSARNREMVYVTAGTKDPNAKVVVPAGGVPPETK